MHRYHSYFYTPPIPAAAGAGGPEQLIVSGFYLFYGRPVKFDFNIKGLYTGSHLADTIGHLAFSILKHMEQYNQEGTNITLDNTLLDKELQALDIQNA